MRPRPSRVVTDIKTVAASSITGLLYGSPYLYAQPIDGTLVAKSPDFTYIDNLDQFPATVQADLEWLTPGEYIEL